MTEPTEPIPLFRGRAQRCAACKRLVAWAGREGFRELRPYDAVDQPTGGRGCDRNSRWRRWLPDAWRAAHEPNPDERLPGNLAPIAVWGLGLAAALILACFLAVYAISRITR